MPPNGLGTQGEGRPLLAQPQHLCQLVIALLFFAGCAGISKIRYSEPAPVGARVVTRQERYVGKMFVSGDVAFHLYPCNPKSTDLLLFPIPAPFPEITAHQPPFVVGLALRTERNGYTFDPASVVFWEHPSKKIRPVRIQGPFACDSPTPRAPWASIAVTPIALQPQICNFMWLEFDAIPPDPSRIFFIEVGGLQMNGSFRELPVIRFQEARRTESVVIP
jgi:hypothetical protein